MAASSPRYPANTLGPRTQSSPSAAPSSTPPVTGVGDRDVDVRVRRRPTAPGCGRPRREGRARSAPPRSVRSPGSAPPRARPRAQERGRHRRAADEGGAQGERSVPSKSGCCARKRYCVGTPIIVVTRRSWISCSTRPGWNERSSTTVAPTHQASSGWQFHPATWNCGSIASTTSSRVSCGDLRDARLFQKQFAWVSTTPFGAASLPEVKMMSSGSSSARRCARMPCRPSRDGTGTSASTPVVPSARRGHAAHESRERRLASDAYSSSTSSSAGSASSSTSASSRGVSRHDSGTKARPAFAQAKNATTWSAELPESVATRSPTRSRPRGTQRRAAQPGRRARGR